MVLNVHLMRYLWEVREELLGNRRQKKQILSRVESSVRDFVIENSGADYNAIVSRFGTPTQIAESNIAEMDTAELLGNLQIHRRIVVIILAAATLLVMVRFGFRLAAYLEYYKKVNGYAVVEVIEIDPTEKNEGGK